MNNTQNDNADAFDGLSVQQMEETLRNRAKQMKAAPQAASNQKESSANEAENKKADAENKSEKRYKTAFLLSSTLLMISLVFFLTLRYLDKEKAASYVAYESVLVTAETTTEPVGNETTLININTADEKELQQLTGIGEKTAQAIVSYRNEFGEFAAIEDIMQVKGIGEKKFDDIKNYICVK